MFTSDQAKYIMGKTAQSFQHPKVTELFSMGGILDSAKCVACETGLNVALGAAIAAAIAAAVATGGAALIPEIAVIAAATGLSETVVTGIIATAAAGGGAGVETVISELCKAMGACD